MALTAALLLPLTTADATPAMDGLRDTEYSLVASSPKDNLLVDVTNGIDDPADPKAKSMDVTDLYMSNSGNSLYFFVELPYLNLSQVYGDWAIVMHLKGANDTLAIASNATHPYGPSNIFYTHAPAPNAVITSNFRGTNPNNEGQNGWAYVNPVNLNLDGWGYPGGNLFGSNRWETESDGRIHGYGTSGAEVIYKPGDGTVGNYGSLEVKVPFADFAADTPGNSALQAPKVGDQILLQFYTTTRGLPGDTGNSHVRGAIDTTPFDENSRKDPNTGEVSPFGGNLSVFASYTIQAPAAFDVAGASANTNTQLTVGFSDAVGASGATSTNYAVENLTENTVIAVTGAQINPSNPAEVILTTDPMGYGDRVKVVVTGVQSTGGVALTPAKNSAEATVPVQVRFNLYDPKNIVTTQGVDPNTSQPAQITVTGSFSNWAANGDGSINSAEKLVNPVDGEPTHYRSEIVLLPPGTVFYKYRMPALLCGDGCKAWDTLNTGGDPNRQVVVPSNTDAVIETHDIAVNNSTPGDPVQVTFKMTDNDNKVAGRDVFVTGTFAGWSSDAGTALQMTAVAGEPNTWTVTAPVNQGYTEYKYIIKDSEGNTLWDEFGGNQFANIVGSGTPLSQTIINVFGTPPVPAPLRALRIAGGLSAATADDKTQLDKDGSGTITVVDAARLLLNR